MLTYINSYLIAGALVGELVIWHDARRGKRLAGKDYVTLVLMGPVFAVILLLGLLIVRRR